MTMINIGWLCLFPEQEPKSLSSWPISKATEQQQQQQKTEQKEEIQMYLSFNIKLMFFFS